MGPAARSPISRPRRSGSAPNSSGSGCPAPTVPPPQGEPVAAGAAHRDAAEAKGSTSSGRPAQSRSPVLRSRPAASHFARFPPPRNSAHLSNQSYAEATARGPRGVLLLAPFCCVALLPQRGSTGRGAPDWLWSCRVTPRHAFYRSAQVLAWGIVGAMALPRKCSSDGAPPLFRLSAP